MLSVLCEIQAVPFYCPLHILKSFLCFQGGIADGDRLIIKGGIGDALFLKARDTERRSVSIGIIVR
jgi:hypothetical protein